MNKEQVQELIREFIWPLAAVALAIAVTVFFLIPKAGEIFSLRAEINQQNQEIRQLRQKLADLSTLSEAELFESSTLVQEALPAEGDLFKNMAMIKRTLGENDVFLDSFKLLGSFATGSAQAAGQVAGLLTVRMEVSFSASLDSFEQMIKSMEKIVPLMAVENIKFGSLEASESGGLVGLSGKVGLASFFSPLPKTMGKVEQPLPKISKEDLKLIEDLKSYARYQAEMPSGEPVSSPSAVGRDNPFSL
jgi:hypothetical protein